MTSSVAEAATASFSTKAGYAVGTAGTAGTLYFGYTVDQWTVYGVIGSLIFAALGFIVGALTNIYYKQKHYRLAVEHFAANGDEG